MSGNVFSGAETAAVSHGEDLKKYRNSGHVNSKLSTIPGKRPKKFLTNDEKLTAIDRVHAGESKASVARNLGIPESTLRGWCKTELRLRERRSSEQINSPNKNTKGILGPTIGNPRQFTSDLENIAENTDLTATTNRSKFLNPLENANKFNHMMNLEKTSNLCPILNSTNGFVGEVINHPQYWSSCPITNPINNGASLAVRTVAFERGSTSRYMPYTNKVVKKQWQYQRSQQCNHTQPPQQLQQLQEPAIPVAENLTRCETSVSPADSFTLKDRRIMDKSEAIRSGEDFLKWLQDNLGSNITQTNISSIKQLLDKLKQEERTRQPSTNNQNSRKRRKPRKEDLRKISRID